MEILNNLPFIEAAVDQIVSPKPTQYFSLDIKKQINKFKDMVCEAIDVRSSHNINIRVFYIQRGNISKRPCIIYLHGLSSYCLEGLNIIHDFVDEFNFCLYDLRGHGKDKHSTITYGTEECHDLYKIMQVLYKKQQKKFILWGRSMGATIALQMLKRYKDDALLRQALIYVVLDSPFSSFKKITMEIAAKNLVVPNFIVEMLVCSVMEKVKEKYSINLSQISFTQLSQVVIPAIFIASSNDQLISETHTEQIMAQYGGLKQKIGIECAHNDPRPKKVLKLIRQKIGRVGMKVNGKDEGGMTERKIKKGLRIFKDEGSLSKVNKQNMCSITMKMEKRKKLKTSKQLIEESFKNRKFTNRVYN